MKYPIIISIDYEKNYSPMEIINSMVKYSNKNEVVVRTIINKIIVIVKPYSDPNHIHQLYQQELSLKKK